MLRLFTSTGNMIKDEHFSNLTELRLQPIDMNAGIKMHEIGSNIGFSNNNTYIVTIQYLVE